MIGMITEYSKVRDATSHTFNIESSCKEKSRFREPTFTDDMHASGDDGAAASEPPKNPKYEATFPRMPVCAPITKHSSLLMVPLAFIG